MLMFKKRLNSRESVSVLELLNYRPMPPNSYKVMFTGDSITIHGALRKVWDNSCGIAATSPERDYVHLVSAGIQESIESPVEALYNNGGNGKIREMLEYLQMRRFSPDLAIIQGGENDKFNDHFRQYYPQLIDHFTCPKIVLGDWNDQEKSEYSERLCQARNLPFVNLFEIASDRNKGGWGGPYNRKDVASHPNDLGHAAIAEATLEKVVITASNQCMSSEFVLQMLHRRR